MGYGILDIGQRQQSDATKLMTSAARAEGARNQMQARLDAAAKSERRQTVGLAAGMGLRYGMSEAGKAAITNVATKAGTAIAGTSGVGATGAALTSTVVPASAMTATGSAMAASAATTAPVAMTSATAAGAAGASGAAAGAQAGSMAGPIGMAAGALFGLLISRLF